MTIPPKVVKTLFLREIRWKVLCRTYGDCPGRGVAGRPEATGNTGTSGFRCDLLEDASEEAGAAAQQPAQDSTQRTAEEASANRRACEAVFATDVRAERVSDGADNICAAADNVVRTEALNDITKL